MKIAQESADVTLGGAIETDAFTIKASAKAFQILSSNLYSNPLGSMIRELSTNAYDAHVMVDTPNKPFNIKLPNALEPTFKIRDFGPGLSEQEIKSVYTTFFESTKTDNNDVVGCLGLGSKSPFGVSDSFTINSFHNGHKTIYSCFLNEQRIPSIAKFHSEESTEPNGIEIEVAIKEDDINVFAREVNTQLTYFKTKPTVTGNSSFEWKPDETYLYEGSDWKMVDNNSRQHSYTARVVQGQIAYPINTNDMGRAYENASSAVQNVLDRPILLEVPIGDVNIAPSREALSYDEATNQNLVKAAQKVVDELPAMIAKAIQSVPTQWEARIKYNEIMSDLGAGYYSRNALATAVSDSGQILWKKKDVSDTDILLRTEYAEKIVGFTKDYNQRYRKDNYYTYQDNHNKFKGKKKDDEKFWTVTARNLKNTLVVFASTNDKAVEARTKQYANDNYTQSVKIVIITTEKSYASIKRILGIPTLIKAEDLPKVRRNGTSGKRSGPKQITIQKFHSTWAKSQQWDTETVEDDLLGLEGYYINLERYDAEFENRTVEIRNYWDAAKELGIIDKDASLYGLRKMNRSREHNLVNFFDHCKEEIEKLSITGVVYDRELTVASKLQDQYRDMQELEKLVNDDSPAMKFIEKMLSIKDIQNSSWDTRRLMQLLGFDQEDKKENINDIVEPLQRLYPMIGQIGYGFDVNYIAQYINNIDELIKCRESKKED